jgi:hypothetical protein
MVGLDIRLSKNDREDPAPQCHIEHVHDIKTYTGNSRSSIFYVQGTRLRIRFFTENRHVTGTRKPSTKRVLGSHVLMVQAKYTIPGRSGRSNRFILGHEHNYVLLKKHGQIYCIRTIIVNGR